MISSRSRLAAGALSLSTLVICLYTLVHLSVKATPFVLPHLDLIVTAIFAFNVPILLAWVSAGILAGLSVAFFSSLAVIFFDLRIGLYGFNILTLVFAVSSCIGYLFLRDKARLDQTYLLQSERIEEEINLLTNSLREHNANIEALEEKLVRYSLLKGVSESLSAVLALDDVLNLIIVESGKIIGKPGRALLFLVDAEKQELRLCASKDDTRVKEKKGDLFDMWVLGHKRSLFIEDVTKDFRFPQEDIEIAKSAFRSLIAQPIIDEGRVIGILRMDSLKDLEYTQDDLRLLDIISDLAAVAIQNAFLYERTQELAIQDSLTGLAVRRYFMERFHHEIKRAARKKEDLSLLMLDIDHFKDYNDTYGHAAGDHVLKHLAKILSGIVQEADVVGRYGGEEMVVLLCGKSKAQAFAEAQKIRQAIKNEALFLDKQSMRLTVSIGVATYPEDAVSDEELIRAADSRLYKAKTEGRDRVC